MVLELLSSLGEFCVKIISYLGYPGIFILMALESMIAPIPSELVMPFAGFLAGQGRFSLALVILVSSAGSIIGSLISYYLGKHGGSRLVNRIGKYLFLDQTDLQKTEQWFSQKGEKTIFISRFIPVVRHLISIPAGMGKMDLKKFCIYTFAGATLWNAFLAYLGFVLGENWHKIKDYSEYVTIPVVLILAVSGAYLVYRHIKHKRKSI
ncbi:MAG: DedA family protein [Nanoarchaeota archaeon]